jgi:hypothetical protein
MKRPSRPRLAIESLEDRLVPAPLNLPNDPSLFAQVSMMAPLAMHIHARVQIFADGQQIIIPANVGVFALGAYPLHTHDNSGLIHMESLVVRNFTLQDFFAIWNTTPSGQAALATLAAAPDVLVTDNGVTTPGLPIVNLHDQDTIVIEALSANPSPQAAANEAFVEKVYADLLHRAPDEGGLVGWTANLDKGMSRVQIVGSIETSAEYQNLEVQALYATLLHRPADAGGLAGFSGFLAGGGSIGQVEARMLASSEYFQDAGATATGFVAALYRDVLQRPSDAPGAASWRTLLDSQTGTQVVDAFLHTTEAESVALQAVYEQYLHRPADSAGLSGFLSALSQGMTEEQVVAAILSSAEYQSRA